MADGNEKSHLKTQFSLVIIVPVQTLKVKETSSAKAYDNVLYMKVLYASKYGKKSEILTLYRYKNRKTSRTK